MEEPSLRRRSSDGQAKRSNEIALEFREKGLFGKRPSTKISPFCCASRGKDLQLTFGNAVLPVN